MNKRFTLSLFLLLTTLHFSTKAQVFYTETFDGSACPGLSGCDPSLVSWTTTVTGAEGGTSNVFYVSCAENGNSAGMCGSGCGSAPDQSLHVGNVPGSPASAFCPGGDCGATYDASGGCETNKRVQSPVINCTPYSGITIAFNYMEQGEGAQDDASLWYFDGATWAMLDALPKTPLGACAPQGTWTAFSASLPASADGNPNVRIGFKWVNDGNNSGSDPSFAVDDITLSSASTPPVANFTYSPASPCTGATVTFNSSTSTGSGLTYSWTFAGGSPSTSAAANPTVTFASAGPHSVTLTVTNADGTDSETQTVTVVACSTPVANFTFSPTPVCAGTVTTFTNTSTGGPFTSVLWSFVGGTPSSSSSMGTATTTWALPGTYTVQIIVTTATGADTLTSTVTVVSCSTAPNASFTVPAGPFCSGQCITFTNTSTGSGPISYGWVTTGGTPATSTAISPTICYNSAGTYTVILIANNAAGTDSVSQIITINPCVAPPVANFNPPTTICRGQCINFTDASTGLPTTWNWSFPGATPGSSSVQNPSTICYNTIGTFPITLVVTNSAGTSTITKTIEVENCSPPSTAFTVSDTRICQGDCITINNITQFGTTYQWTFPGGTPSSSTLEEPGTVCFDSSGVFDVTLIAFNAYGSDTTIQNIIVDTIPIIEAFPDEVAVSLGNSIDLSVVANGDVTYYWMTSDTASIGDTSLAVVTVTPTAPGVIVYYIIATGGNGCPNVDSVIVEVLLTDVIALPNGFSPNNDGNNDVLRVLGPGINTMKLIVYNRYGQLVFETSDQAVGWDGKHNGKDADPGVFAWYLEYTLVNGSSGVQKGNVTLIR